MKMVTLYDGTQIDFDKLYPNKTIYGTSVGDYEKEDDGKYDNLLSEEDKIKYGIS